MDRISVECGIKRLFLPEKTVDFLEFPLYITTTKHNPSGTELGTFGIFEFFLNNKK